MYVHVSPVHDSPFVCHPSQLLDVAVTWQSPYIIIPQSGSMSK